MGYTAVGGNKAFQATWGYNRVAMSLGVALSQIYGKEIPEAAMVGEGDAWILTNGGLVAARWSKPSLEAVTTYVDADGNPVKLTPGRTWVALPPPGEGAKL